MDKEADRSIPVAGIINDKADRNMIFVIPSRGMGAYSYHGEHTTMAAAALLFNPKHQKQ